MKATKAQTTVFMILGIMIVLAMGFGIYLATQTVMKPKIITPETALQEYVQDCIKQTAVQAIKQIGDNGGYADTSNNQYKTFNFRTEPAEGDGLAMSEFGMYSIPYWWYMKTPNNCNNCYLTSDNMPVIPEIEEQINDYVDKKIGECVESGELRGYSIEAGKPEIETQITRDRTVITAKYPIEATRGEIKTKTSEFQAEIDINLGGMLELAKEIITLEKEKAVIEERVMHVLGAHMGASFDRLPPISEITHDYFMVHWKKEIAEMQAKQALNSYMPMLRFARTGNENTINKGGRYAKGFYNAMQIPGLKKDYPFDTSISYNDWPMYFQIRPDSMTGTMHKQSFYYNIMQPFQTNTYEFYYDISIPLLVQITDKKALNSEGYTLTFAVEANIRDNKDPTEWNKGEGTLGPWTGENAKTQSTTTERKQGECVQNIRKYRCSLDSRNYDTLMQCAEMCYTSRKTTEQRKPMKARFCAEEQRISGTIGVNVKSGGTALTDAGVSYSCGSYQTCTLGTTDSEGNMASKMPICYGGILTVNKEGYYTEKIPLTTQISEMKNINVNMKKEKDYTVWYKKYRLSKNAEGEASLGQAQTPEPPETALIRLEKIKETPISAEFTQTIILNGDETGTIKLVPGTYRITIQHINENGITIPKECKQVCTKEEDGECAEYKKLPEEDMKIKPAMLGGAELDAETGYWTVTEQTISADFGNILLYGIESLTPTCIDTEGCIHMPCIGMDEMGKAKEYSLRYRSYLEPKLQ